MDVRIEPRRLSGTIEAISSKSYAHRALIAAALCKEATKLKLNHISADILATIKTIEALGAEVEVYENENSIKVIPGNCPEKLEINCNESGTTGRLVLPVMSAISPKGVLTGEGSLKTRPFGTLCKAMEKGGVSFSGYSLPISYEGQLMSGDYEIAGNESSQYISGLMFALPMLSGDSKIKITTELESKGYIDITLEVLEKFGISSGYEIKGGQKFVSPETFEIEGDWSNASYWICAGIMPEGLNPCSLQKDRLFVEVCEKEEIDGSEIPDLIPALAVYATQKKAKTKISNIGRLRIKESDRIQSICHMIEALGGQIEVEDNEMVVYPSQLTGGEVNSYNDHRIVMSAAIASSFCSGPVIIRNSEAVNKSYRKFFDDFEMLGGKVDVL